MAEKVTAIVNDAEEVPTWEVVIRLGVDERVYTSQTAKRYKACIDAIEQFIEEFGLPGRAYEYWGSNQKGGFLEISARCSSDGRITSQD